MNGSSGVESIFTGSIWAGFFAAAALQFLFTGLLKLKRQGQARLQWERARGTIVASGIENMVPQIVVEYPLDNDQVIRAVPRTSTMTGQFLVGRRVTVWYDPSYPSRCEVEIFQISILTPLGHLLAATSMTLLAWRAIS